MANERIADALPYDFLPYEIVGVKPDTLSEVVVLPTQTTLETGPVQYAEKVYLHTDRTYYNSGDDIWFKSYVTDASNDKPSPIARNLHVELISSTSELIQSRVLRIEAGTGNGDFHLSDSLPSGRYTLRAYTNYMRNFDDHFFFNKGIVVVNPADRGNELIDSIKQVENKLDVSFYPEGGSLVDNVQSVVAFKAVDATGKGCDITGELYSSSGELITRFESTHLGMGLFTLKPIPGISYYAIMKNNAGAESKTTLPKSFPKGSTISTFVTVDNKLLLTVSLNEETLLSLKSSDLILTFSSRNLVIYTAKIQIGGLQNNYIIPVDKLSGGILKVTVTKSDGLPLSERLIYLEKHNKVFLNVVTDKNEYTPREKVIIGLSLSGSESVQEGTTLSISVVEKSFTDASLYPTTIASWFLLESDVRGPVEEPSYYFDPQNKNRLQDLDLLLLTQGWRDFQWKYDSLSAFSSEKGFTISGKVKRIIGDKPYEDAKLNVGIFGDNTSQVTTGKTDSMGVFRIEGIEFSGRKNLFISATGKNEVPVGRIFLDPLYYRPAEIEDIVPSFTTKILKPEIYNDLRQDVITKIALKKKYKLNDTIDIGEVIVTARKPDPPETIKVKESRRVYGTPDKEVIITPAMDNFAGDVFSLISGRFVGVQVKRKGMESVSVIIRGQKGTDGSSALILLDGFEVLPQDIVTSVLPLPVNMIDRIDVLNASPLYGMRGANGVVNIITRSTGPRRLPIELGPNSKNVVINGYDRPRIFYSPKHNIPSGSAEVPDIRTTIFWEPNIKIGKSGNAKLEYFNADNSTSITVIVEGITREGIPVTGKVRYEVR
jgi:hypothetical protein